VKLGDGLDKDTTMGPLANPRRLDAMEAIVNDAKSRGGKIVAGGKRRGNQGYFFEPTVVTDIPDDSKVMTEEPFGPIAPLTSFTDWEDALARANALPYGLAGYVFTDSQRIAESAVRDLKAGNIGINQMAPSLPDAPLGGLDQSGLGYEGGSEGVRAFVQMKLINRTV
jgi:succinate-semialdehyde dehydrogenase/glutarate-semialdehyde dehydrogenase